MRACFLVCRKAFLSLCPDREGGAKESLLEVTESPLKALSLNIIIWEIRFQPINIDGTQILVYRNVVTDTQNVNKHNLYMK